MSRLSPADIDEVTRLQRKILHLFVWIDQLLERERSQSTSDEPPDVDVGGVALRDALPGLLDDITSAVAGIAAIVSRGDQGGANRED
jgi:hypothetical protein